jgi:hypothetical protein
VRIILLPKPSNVEPLTQGVVGWTLEDNVVPWPNALTRVEPLTQGEVGWTLEDNVVPWPNAVDTGGTTDTYIPETVGWLRSFQQPRRLPFAREQQS